MIWFGKSFINFCKSFINLIKLVSTRTCSSARVRRAVPAGPSTASRAWPAGPGPLVVSLALESHWRPGSALAPAQSWSAARATIRVGLVALSRGEAIRDSVILLKWVTCYSATKQHWPHPDTGWQWPAHRGVSTRVTCCHTAFVHLHYPKHSSWVHQHH